MSIDRLTRVNQLLKQEIAETLFRVVNDPGSDIGAVTVTRVETSSNLRSARVYVSIRGEPARQEVLLRHLRGHRKEIQQSVSRHVVLKYTPQLTFEIDHSLEDGDHVLNVIARLEKEHPEQFEDPDTTQGDEHG
ncbi:MAG TPA: 30S ribosome-binding factor RbfA [Kiritimatiellia bacterium]|nr:30S ribosome-binding factor RbfA [Kiritimatiellia bacterium]HMO97546.1 30S ribosome-binding factor RbfA [Kiritimatiellia bacterium]